MVLYGYSIGHAVCKVPSVENFHYELSNWSAILHVLFCNGVFIRSLPLHTFFFLNAYLVCLMFYLCL